MREVIENNSIRCWGLERKNINLFLDRLSRNHVELSHETKSPPKLTRIVNGQADQD